MINENFVDIYSNTIKKHWDLIALDDYFKKDESYTYGDMGREITKLHILFQEIGIVKGDKIALIGRNNPRWCIAFLAITTYGAVVVPILQDFSANDIQHIMNHSQAKLLFCGDQYWDLVDIENVPALIGAISLTDYGCVWESMGARVSLMLNDGRVNEIFDERFQDGFSAEELLFEQVAGDDLMEINYTSGTTGFTKGVMLSSNALANNIVYANSEHILKSGDRILSFLPLAHAYGCTFEFLFPLSEGAHITLLGKIPSPKILIEALTAIKPNLVICVPLIIEKIYKKQIMPQLDKSLMKIALKLPLLDEGIHAIIRNKLIESFGGNFSQVIVGGAPLNSEVETFMNKIKFPLTVGYGMTECAPLISFIKADSFVKGSCGKVITGMEIKVLSSDPEHITGEFLVRGENVMMGYYKNPDATAAAIDSEGWLHTGDMGTIDSQGNIFIRGRNKTMILRANGQNIYPEEIEAKLNNLPCVLECLVVDKGTKLVALVYPDYDQADNYGLSSSDIRNLMSDNVKALNELVAPYEQISEIILYPNEFEKTPKKSIKRYLYNV